MFNKYIFINLFSFLNFLFYYEVVYNMKYYCFNIFHRNICTNIDEKNCSARESVACSRSMKVTGEWIELR